MTDPRPEAGAHAPGGSRPRGTLTTYVAAVTAVAAATGIGLAVFRYATLADLTMLYVMAIMLASLSGRGPALVAASLAVVAFNLCFIPPRFTLGVHEPHHLLTFAVMFGAGLVISTLTERLRRQAEETREAALRAHTEELRSSLLSAVSHDLRTPLAVITGAATTLRDDAARLPQAARDELLSSIIDDAQRLERILGNLLQLTRVESGLVPAREWIPLEELVGAALTRLEDAIADRAITIEVSADLLVAVDPVLFAQVLINLIDNALKHGAPPIELRARRRGASIELEVRDHGQGIPVADRPRLFEKFVRASTAPGAGLGLAVVRAIVEAHGGTVSVEAPPDGGARFRVELPTGEGPPGPPAPTELATLAVREASA